MKDVIETLRPLVRWAVTLGVVYGYLYMVISGADVPETYYGIVAMVMAFWFKEKE